MSNLDAALTSLKATLGDFDNIKLLLAGDDAMTREIVDADLLALAGKLAAGEIRSVENLGEAPLRDARIAF